MSQEKSNLWRALSVATTAGFTLLSSIGLGVFLGYQGDHYFDIFPWGLLTGSLFGGVFGLYALMRKLVAKE